MSDDRTVRFDALREDHADLETVWLDGEFVPWESATVHVLTHALHYGTSVFEGVRCHDGPDGPHLFRWDDHLDRFEASASVYDIDIAFDRTELTRATKRLITDQSLSDCYVRLIAFYGCDRLGVSPSRPTELPSRIAIACWPWESYLGPEALTEGIDVMVSSWRRFDHDQVPTTAKTCGAYVNNVLATEEAGRAGYDEAIVLNGRGRVAEGAGENLFLVRDGDLYTPGPDESALNGITRRTVCALARDAGITVHEDARIGRGELYTADELFLTGTAAEVTPVRSVDDVSIGVGPVTERLQSRYQSLVAGELDRFEEWFTPVA